jgi:3-isopropylmalate/(R)-2-methylmalate dehydratase small subunit
MKFKGKVWKFGNNIYTDVIIPARYLQNYNEKSLAKHCMEDIDESFSKNVKKGDIIVAGENFGCGSSREHAPISIKASGISCIIAKSYARIFFRNAINIGLPIFISSDIYENTEAGNLLEVNAEKGTVRNITKNIIFTTSSLPSFIQQIIKNNGLINYLNRKNN